MKEKEKGKDGDGDGDGDDARLEERWKTVRKRNGSANILCIALARWMERCNQVREDKSDGNVNDLILPSNEDWRYRVYYRLVELQRECDNVGEERVAESRRLATEEGSRKSSGYWEWEPKRRVYDLKGLPKREVKGSARSVIRPGWRIKDILLAAEVLGKVQPPPIYSDEAEMRRVFGLVYDVLRYKRIFTRALEDIGFWRYNDAIKDREKMVWLLLYDMQGRKFARLPPAEMVAMEEREKMFQAAGLKEIENALLEVKTHVAASISRLRIRGSALKLDELLPTRLRVIEGVRWTEEAAIASGWINTEKVRSKEEFLEEMSKLNLVCCCEEGDARELEEMEFRWTFDSICPKMVNLEERARETLAVSTLERSLCLGAATLARAIRIGRLCGPVVLTHSLAPRHTGYLAGLLADIEHAGTLFAFGAADHRSEYETYLKHLDGGGVTLLQRCRVFSEKYVSDPGIGELERATVVLAVPSCSYTGVTDIVDLAVARGGDADLLESLTNADHEQWPTILADQMSTLKYALTRPNVQFLVYQVHTILPSETTDMIRGVVDCVNRMAVEKYIREHPRKAAKLESRGDDRASTTVTGNVVVPDSDLFEVGSIEDIYGENATRMLDPGCFLAIIKRKEMIQFDSVFMIKVAESKGLFGDPNVGASKAPKQRCILERSLLPRSSQTSARKQTKRAKIDRLTAHTHSSLSRSIKQENRICPRHKRWCSNWRESTESQVPYEISKSEVTTGSWSNLAVSLPNARRDEKESGKSSRKKELRMIRSMFSPRSQFDAAAGAAILKTALQPEQTSSILTNLLTIKPLLRTRSTLKEEWRNDITSSTILRSPILARAARRVPLETNEIEDREEEKVEAGSKRSLHSRWTTRKTSRLLHPAGSPSNLLDDSFSFDLV